jgi:transcriptional regulator with GAF, ATPase, and Fis domain
VSGEALAALKAYDWPGNVRELQNVIERAVITTRGDSISFELPSFREPSHGATRPGARASVHVHTADEVRDAERANVIAALDKTHWKVYGPGGAAQLLGIKPGTLAARMKKLGLQRRVHDRG